MNLTLILVRVRLNLRAIFILLLLALSCRASAAQKIVGFSPDVKPPERVKTIESIGGKVLRELHLIDALVATIPDNIKDADVYSLNGVISIEEDRYFKWIDDVPVSFPLSSVEAAIALIKVGEYEVFKNLPPPVAQEITDEEKEIPWGVKRVNASTAWHITMGQGVKVAVIDTGIDYTHPDIQGNYADGYNAIILSTSPADAMDDNGHGTHVAGTIAAVRDSKGVAGVAPGTRIYGVKVLDYYGSGQVSWIISGIEWAVDNKVNVINMSLGASFSIDSLAKAVTAAYKKGVVIVCAAGNTSEDVNYPAKYPESIAVSASDSSDKIASFSSRGPEIAFIAPGVEVYSTTPGASYSTKSGTSMASPHVAGLAALAVYLGADTPVKVREALTKAAVKLDLQPDEQGAGLIDAGKLVRALHTDQAF